MESATLYGCKCVEREAGGYGDSGGSPNLTSVITQPLTESQNQRLSNILDGKLLNVILKYGFIAGGCVVYVMVDDVPLSSVGDIDVFISHTDQLRQCFNEITAIFYPSKMLYQRMNSTIKIIVSHQIPIQLILTDNVVNSQIREFDMDMVQCAIHGSILDPMSTLTRMAYLSHQSHTIKYMLDYAYNPMRLMSRLNKAHRKGFHINRSIETIEQVGLKLYRPHVVDREKWEIEKNMRLGFVSTSKHVETNTLSLKQWLPMDNGLTDDIDSVWKDPIRNFRRETYEGWPETPEKPNTPDIQMYVCMESCNHVTLPQNIRPFTVVIPPKQVSFIGYKVKALKKKLELDPENSRLFYICRALELVDEGDYIGAVTSAISDSNKLSTCSGNSMFMMGQAMEMNMFLSDIKYGSHESCSINTIERLLGGTHAPP